jgi:hypothetical protein
MGVAADLEALISSAAVADVVLTAGEAHDAPPRASTASSAAWMAGAELSVLSFVLPRVTSAPRACAGSRPTTPKTTTR